MSDEHVQIVRRFLDAYVTGDYKLAAAELHADAEWHNTPSFPGPRTVFGPEAIRQFWREMFGAFASSSRLGSGMKVEQITDYENIVVAEVHGWGAGSALRLAPAAERPPRSPSAPRGHRSGPRSRASSGRHSGFPSRPSSLGLVQIFTERPTVR
jgi:hypothetical protein